LDAFPQKIAEFRTEVDRFLSATRPVIDSASAFKWDPSSGFLAIIRRAIIRRQFESLETTAHLVDSGRGFAAVSQLRPACEELIWAKYLAKLDPSVANELIGTFLRTEIYDSLTAQDQYLGRSATKEMGLLQHLQGATKYQPQVRAQLKLMGMRLKWPKRSVEQGGFPSVRWLAGATDMLRDYSFLYHATSRYVHFSPTELARRVWGTPTQMSVKSSNFGDYWNAFALTWSFRLFAESYLVLHESLESEGMANPDMDEREVLAAFEKLNEIGLIPIITPDELAWPSQ
jgi:hypothetical protein